MATNAANLFKKNMESVIAIRNSLDIKQQKEIEELYSQAANNISKVKSFQKTYGSTDSEFLRKQYLDNILKQINSDVTYIGSQIRMKAVDGIREMATETIKGINKWGENYGLNIKGAYAYVPNDVIEALVSGRVYNNQMGTNWSLSKAIWGMQEETQKKVYNIVARGIAENKSSIEIAQELEAYVDPAARKDFNWSKVNPRSKVEKIDFSAQRLIRTLRHHAYQQSFVKGTYYNPFITMYRWESALAPGRTCAICEARDGELFKKDELPLDHPMGLCTVTAEIPLDNMQISDMLADWANSPSGKYPDLDMWQRTFYTS